MITSTHGRRCAVAERGRRPSRSRREAASQRPATARTEAVRVLARVLAGESLDAALPESDARLADPRDRAQLRAIAFAVLRRPFRYRALAAMLLARGRPKPLLEAAIVAGLAQIEDELGPVHAIVDGSVGALAALGESRLVPVANAVLRRFLREREALLAGLPDDELQRFQHPRWLIEALRHDWPGDWPAILAANDASAPLWLRVNRRRATRAAVLAELEGAGIAAVADPLLPDAIRVDERLAPQALPAFVEGRVSVQDASAQWIVELMDLGPGLRVLDACAAPGGKTCHIAERAPALAALLALDVDPARVARIDAALERLGLVANTRAADATRPADWWDGTSYDRILIDAPCTGTGVIRRHPDIRLLRRPGDVQALAARQDALLDALWPLLAPGGRLVYATCSVLAAGNAERVAAFLSRTPDAMALDAVPEGFGRRVAVGRQRLPGEHGGDGFHAAVLGKRAR
jgi:16S rRNA (cytosine967-C5)-methyltransferase